LKAKISLVLINDYPDGSTEFEIRVQGSITRCVVDYGDGVQESLDIPMTAKDVIMFCEHRFKPGKYHVVIAILQNNWVSDRRKIMLGRNG
jgi:hypothetical protein